MRILMTIAYDGTNFSGWQKQKLPEVRTVEGELEKALRKLFRDPVLECIGASRTDAGVHALGQRAVVDVETKIPAGCPRVPAGGHCSNKGGGGAAGVPPAF